MHLLLSLQTLCTRSLWLLVGLGGGLWFFASCHHLTPSKETPQAEVFDDLQKEKDTSEGYEEKANGTDKNGGKSEAAHVDAEASEEVPKEQEPAESRRDDRPEGSDIPAEGGVNDDPPEAQSPEATPEPPCQPPSPSRIAWASLQWPPTLSAKAGQATSWVYGQVYAPGLTDRFPTSAAPCLRVQLGYGPWDSDPSVSPQAWVWSDQVLYHKNAGINDNNQEFRGRLTVAKAGLYRYTFRYAVGGGAWQIADRSDFSRQGTGDGVSLAQMGALSVVQAGTEIRVASYNLHCLVDRPAERLAEIARQVQALGIDLLALQEVCRPASGGDHAVSILLRDLAALGETSYQGRFVQTHVGTHSQVSFDEGIGFLSKWPILEDASADLQTPQAMITDCIFPRKALWSRIATPAGIVAFTSTHLDFKNESCRIIQAQTLKAWLLGAERAADTFVIGGDFNATPAASSFQYLTSSQSPDLPAFADLLAPFDPGPTFPAIQPASRIDYLFSWTPASAPWIWKPITGQRIFAQPLRDLYLSDHLGVFSSLRVP